MRRLAPYLLLPLAACGTSISGKYDLRSIDGQPLPWEQSRYTGAEGRILRIRELTEMTLELNDDGTCSFASSSSDREIPGADPELRRPFSTQVGQCTWTANGAALAFATPEDGADERLVGSAADGMITLTLTGTVLGEEVILVYEFAKR